MVPFGIQFFVVSLFLVKEVKCGSPITRLSLHMNPFQYVLPV